MVSGIYGLGGLAAGGGSDQEATLHEHPVASTMCRATSFTRFDDDRILAWVVSSVFMLSRATGYTQPFSNVEELLTFRDWTPQNSCPNKKMRAQLEAMALKLDQILMQESESEESLDPYHCKGDEDVEDEDPEEDKVPEDEDLEDEDEDEALAMSDDEPMYRHELCDETSDEENEYLNMLLEQSSESEDEHDPA